MALYFLAVSNTYSTISAKMFIFPPFHPRCAWLRSKPRMRVGNLVRSNCATKALIQRLMVTAKATAKSTKDAGNTILAMKSSWLLASFPPSDKSPWRDYKLTDIK